PVQLFQTHADILSYWQKKIRYLLVDEYQDTNSSQYLLVKLLVGARGALTVVGDDDQSIYAWRGARPENMLLLKEDYPQLEVIKLRQNYSYTRRIFRVVKPFNTQNPHEFSKGFVSENGFGDSIPINRCPYEEAKAQRICGQILTQKL